MSFSEGIVFLAIERAVSDDAGADAADDSDGDDMADDDGNNNDEVVDANDKAGASKAASWVWEEEEEEDAEAVANEAPNNDVLLAQCFRIEVAFEALPAVAAVFLVAEAVALGFVDDLNDFLLLLYNKGAILLWFNYFVF